LLTYSTAYFSEFYVRAHLIVYDNVAETARNTMAHERLFRLGIASDLITFAADVVLIVAIYVILKPINLALLAAWLACHCPGPRYSIGEIRASSPPSTPM
jgi:hypothetical protein